MSDEAFNQIKDINGFDFKKYLNSKEPVWVNLTNASDIIEVEDDPVQTATNVTFNGTVKVIYKIVFNVLCFILL